MFNYCPSCGQQGTVEQQDKTNYECSNCQWHFWNNAKGSVAVAFVKDNQVLVSERAIEPHKGYYDLPGGYVDFSETAQAAAIREVKEELGLDITEDQLQLIGVYNDPYDEGISTIDVTFMVTEWQGEFQALSDSAQLVWKPFTFIDAEEFWPPYTGLSQTLTELSQQK